MRDGVTKKKAFGVYPVGGWYLAGKSQRQDHLARSITTILIEVSLYINIKPLIHENQALFCFKHVFFELDNESDALMKVA